MSKKVYLLINEEINEIMCASEDKDFIREVMCDFFMDDVEYQWYWDLSWSVYEIEELGERAKMIWDDMLEWYDDFIHIQVIEVV